ncbi:MAG: hypothetical protein ACFFG0_04850 [Candidatus Thorarchaeota archaeon]
MKLRKFLKKIRFHLFLNKIFRLANKEAKEREKEADDEAHSHHTRRQRI